MFWESFQSTVPGVLQILVLGAAGFVLFKKNILGEDGLRTLSRLVIEITLPAMIFSHLIRDFSFEKYPGWWRFPFVSLAVTAAGLVLGGICMFLIRGKQQKLQFLNLVTFQNSGYLPLVLVAALLPADQKESMFIYIFLFLLGFNLLMWSLGVYLLTFTRTKKFELGSLFSPPVIATFFSLGFIYLGFNTYTPEVIIKPLTLIGDCTLPLAMFVVGGNLAAIKVEKPEKKAVFLVVLVKLMILPLLGLLFLANVKVPELLGLLIIMQLAMPPATTLSVIIRHYNKEDLLISQGIFFGHIICLITIPVFLSLYFSLTR